MSLLGLLVEFFHLHEHLELVINSQVGLSDKASGDRVVGNGKCSGKNEEQNIF
jgi:hypothetical protein